MPYKDLAVPREDKYSEDDMNHLTFINNKIPFTVNLPNQPYVDAVSYTHLTLPTNLSV